MRNRVPRRSSPNQVPTARNNFCVMQPS
jgi:hypothetical protein